MSRPYTRTSALLTSEVARLRDEFVTVQHAWEKLRPFLPETVKWHAFRHALAGKAQTPAVVDAIRQARLTVLRLARSVTLTSTDE